MSKIARLVGENLRKVRLWVSFWIYFGTAGGKTKERENKSRIQAVREIMVFKEVEKEINEEKGEE